MLILGRGLSAFITAISFLPPDFSFLNSVNFGSALCVISDASMVIGFLSLLPQKFVKMFLKISMTG